MRMRLDRNADAYLLTERELKVLLAGQNNDFVFGLLSDKAAECSETKADVYTALADMVRMEKISTDGESFRIAEPIASCVRQIGAAETGIIRPAVTFWTTSLRAAASVISRRSCASKNIRNGNSTTCGWRDSTTDLSPATLRKKPCGRRRPQSIFPSAYTAVGN